MKTRLLVTVRQLQDDLKHFEARFDAAGARVAAPRPVQAFSAKEMTHLLQDADVAIVGDDDINESVLAANAHIRRIVKWGIGMDSIDLDAARRMGIDVVNTPEALPATVAEGAIGYLLALARDLPAMDRGVRAGEWTKPRGTRLLGKTMGIVGMGRIGQEVATRASAFGMRVIGTDVRSDARLALPDGTHVPATPLRELLATSDVILLCASLTPASRHLLDKDTLRTVKRGALLVNVSRGALVETGALVTALKDGTLAGAALDVYEDEPLSRTHALTSLPNVFLGSHNIQNTHESVRATNELAVTCALEALR